MKYICHKPYRKKGASNRKFFIKKGKEFDTIGNFIVKDSEAICTITSQDAYKYFAKNDDGYGLQRGQLTYQIAFSKRKPDEKIGFRFTEKEREMLETQYSHFLKPDNEYLLFNYDFFNADINQLRQLNNKLKIKNNTQEA